MIEKTLTFALKNFSVVMFVAAFLKALLGTYCCCCGSCAKPQRGFVEQWFRWTLLLSVGVQGVYTFIVHVFFPHVSAHEIGWAASPFQYEVGIADLTVGVLGIVAFWSNFSFRIAATIAAVIWYGGDAIGHVRQMIVAHNFAPGNAGPWFWTDVLVPILLTACALILWRQGAKAHDQDR